MLNSTMATAATTRRCPSLAVSRGRSPGAQVARTAASAVAAAVVSVTVAGPVRDRRRTEPLVPYGPDEREEVRMSIDVVIQAGVPARHRPAPPAAVRHTVRVTPPTVTPSAVEAALVACADGDRAPFGLVYDALAPVAYGTSLGVLRDPDHAAEVMQEVMVEVWQTAARFDPSRASARTWVATLARRRAVDRVRAEQARRDRDQRDVDTAYAGPARDVVAEDVERRLEGAAVRRCLESLTGVQREAVIEAYYGARTYREVADRLGAALPTVKTRIRDGLSRLRDCLGVRHG